MIVFIKVNKMKPMLIFSTVIFLVSTARIPHSTVVKSDDILYHLVCNFSNIKYVFYYPINDDGKVAEDLVFNPFQIYPEQLTETAIEYMRPMCTKSGETKRGINHEWFISSENFTKPSKVIIKQFVTNPCLILFILILIII